MVHKFDVEEAKQFIKRWAPFLSEVGRWVYVHKSDVKNPQWHQLDLVHACRPSLIYERLRSLPPKEVVHLFGHIKENDDNKLACNNCGFPLGDKLEMAVRLMVSQI